MDDKSFPFEHMVRDDTYSSGELDGLIAELLEGREVLLVRARGAGRGGRGTGEC